ncbi:metalloregulator ArsR/SmtB family transcription factor [Streptomyces sp. NPDC047000]|uniref:ArsR/SmtB family transcription factor n=1 Tax=Streptomyces sp. NPDC047000 TaxID=3155474 RepID=UPI0033F487D1
MPEAMPSGEAPTAAGASGVDRSVALLQAVADPVRWSLLRQLAGGQACVCELQKQLPIPANLLSYHLKVLREAGLIVSSRRGRWIDYVLAPDALARLHAALPGLPEPGRVEL